MIEKDIKQQFSEVYDKYIDSIYRFAYIKTSSQLNAEDIASEVFTRYWQSLQKKTTIENERAFLYKTARNIVIDFYRKRGRTPETISTDTDFDIASNQNLQDEANTSLELGTIKNAISQLKDDYQNVVIWHYLDDMKIEEVAKAIGKSESATRMLLSRALKEIKEKTKEA
jgi:RNA polymerase sigma-70 factor (ECF subfamily)